ncbi:MAG: dTMP kinase [Candidatus Manganitrophaceae bacterium]
MERKPLKGHFITFEGIEGSGKTTQLALLADDLERRGHAVVRTREPGGTKIGDAIRSLILDVRHQEIDPKAELLLYFASRVQHLKEVVLPALAQGKIVLCDRFSDATLAYQGDGRGIPAREIEIIGRFATDGLRPDLTLLLDIDVKSGLARLKNRGEINRLDLETLSFHEAVRKGYRKLAKRNRRRIQTISADAGVEQIAKKIRKVVDVYLRIS